MDNMKLFHGMGTGIRLTLSFEEMKKQVVVVPPQDEQQSIVAYIEEKCEKIDKLASELQSEIDYLKEYKQRLIADCVTGQVNVQNEMIYNKVRLKSCVRKEVFDIVAQEKGENLWNSRKFVVSLPQNKNANEREQTISKD